MSCKHGNHEDACDICEEISAAYESGLAACLAAPSVANGAAEIDAVAEAIFKVIKPSNMIDKDWKSGAILGFENGFRDQVKEAARAAIAALHKPVVAMTDSKLIEALHELALLMSDTIRGEYEPDSFTLQPAVHALAAVGIEFPDDDYLLTQRESCVVVPVKPNAAMLKAMAESRAVDDEGEFPAMLDLLDFSGENKIRTVLEAAYVAALAAHAGQGAKE